MELHTEVGVSSGAEPPSKRASMKSSREEKQEEEVQKMLVVLSKAVLSNKMQLKQLVSIVMITYQVPTEHAITKAVKEGSQLFMKTQQSMKDRGETQEVIKNKLGTPGVFSVNAVIKFVIEQTKDTSFGKMLQEAAKTKWSSCKVLQAHVPHLRAAKMYHGNVKKLEVALPQLHTVCPQEAVTVETVTPTHALKFVLELLDKDKDCKQLVGVPPAGDMERQLQAFLDRNADA